MQYDHEQGQMRFTPDEWQLLGFAPAEDEAQRTQPDTCAYDLWQYTSNRLTEVAADLMHCLITQDEAGFDQARADQHTLTALGNGLMHIAVPETDPEVAQLNQQLYGSPDS